MPRCLVTGGAGFIGSHIVDALLEHGYEVRVFDNFSTGARGNLLHIAGDVELVEGDLRSFEGVMRATNGCSVVFHQAALPSVPRSVRDPSTTNEVNITGTLNVLSAARAAGVERVVYASSSSVYGAIPLEVKHENLPVAPLSPYGVSKLAGEAYCISFFEVYGLPTVCLRYFNIFGPRQSPLSEYAAVIPNFISAALLREPPVIFGDGLQCRDFTYVANAVDANLRAAFTGEAQGKVFNVGCGERNTLLDLLAAISDVAGQTLEPEYVASRAGDVKVSVADIARARAILGYEPVIGLREGLERTYQELQLDGSLLTQIDEHRRWLEIFN